MTLRLSWSHEFGHGIAKLSYGAWERDSVISSWMIHQEETGIDREIADWEAEPEIPWLMTHHFSHDPASEV